MVLAHLPTRLAFGRPTSDCCLIGWVSKLAENALGSIRSMPPRRQRAACSAMRPPTETAADRAVDRVNDLKRTLSNWHSFYAGYDPLFTWWTAEPFDEASDALREYASFVRKELVGVSVDDEDALIGDPIGNAALLDELAFEIDAATRTAEAEGATISGLRRESQDLVFVIRLDRVPHPPAPGTAPAHLDVEGAQATLIVSNLAPGEYRLVSGGRTFVTARAEQWARGVALEDPSASSASEALRAELNAKNQLYFANWRAVNGFYIYGNRERPFGLVSFPPEMILFEQLIAEDERRILQLARPPEARSFKLSRIGD